MLSPNLEIFLIPCIRKRETKHNMNIAELGAEGYEVAGMYKAEFQKHWSNTKIKTKKKKKPRITFIVPFTSMGNTP